MQAFTARRALHQNCTAAEVTGELPNAMFLAGAVHRGDITDTGAGCWDDLLGYRDRCFLWSGNLDAPCLLPAGSVRPVNISPEIGGMGYEGNVSRVVPR